MIYQIAEKILPFILILDLILVVLLLLTIRRKQLKYKRLIFSFTLVGFIGLGLFKLLFIEPHSFPSTPTEIRLLNDKSISKVYYIGTFENQPRAFWTEFILGEKKDRMFDLESSVHDSLIIAKKIKGNWYNQTVRLEFDKIHVVRLAENNFRPDLTGQIRQTIKAYRFVEFGNYLSNILTLLYMGGLILRIINYWLQQQNTHKPGFGASLTGK